MDQNNTQQIGRYLLIAFLFVLVFIGAAYLVYRLTRGNADQPVAVRPTPTPTVAGPSIPTGGYPTILPAPTLAPVDPRQYVHRPQPFANAPKVVATTVAGQTVAQDGRGNLLFNNLTHDEHFQLERERIQANARLQLAQEETQRRLALAQLENQQALERLRSQTQEQLTTAQLQAQQRNQALAQELALAQLDNRLAQQRLQVQREDQRNQAASQTTPTDQIRLIQAQTEAQARLAQIQAEQQRLTQTAQAQNEALLTDAQAKRQIATTQAQTAQQAALQRQQLQADLARLTLQQKQRLAEQAYEAALRQNDQQYALLAMRIQNDIARAIQADRHNQILEYTQLQAQITENLIILSSLYPSSRYGSTYGYGRYGNYGYGGYSRYGNQYQPSYY